MPDTPTEEKTAAVPTEYMDELINPVAVQFGVSSPFIPDGAELLVIDLEAEVVCHDVAMTIYMDDPHTFYINKMALAVPCNSSLGKEPPPESNCRPVVAIVDHKHPDSGVMGMVDASRIKELHKVVLWRDVDGLGTG